MIITIKFKVGGVQRWLADVEKVNYWLFRGYSWKHSLVLFRRKKTVSAESPHLATSWKGQAIQESLASGQNGLSEVHPGQHSWPKLTLCLQGQNCGLETQGVNSTSCFCILHSVLHLSLFVALILVLNSIRHMQNIHHYPTSKFGDTLRESDTDLRNPGF